jgi:hypothetical protein
LSLPNTQLSDTGSYSVVVTNPVGATTSVAAALAVNPATMAPTITKAPANVMAVAGASVAFNVIAIGTAPLSYEWRKNGAAIAGATTSVLAVGGVQAADAASYTVTITNGTGAVTSTPAALTLAAAPIVPTISTQPRSQTVTLGSTVTFDVAADGTSPFTYRWHKNGVPISGATSATLTVVVTSVSNAGSYSVAVANSAGAVTSNAAALAITPSSTLPSILLDLSDLTIRPGTRAQFVVTADGAAPLNYEWRKNGITIAGANGPTLDLTNVQSGHEGYYSVVVTNAFGSAISRPALLLVRGRSYAGTYFGAFGSGGTFALTVRDDNTGVFLGFATGAQIAFVNRGVLVDEDGHFRLVTTTTASATSEISGTHVAAAGTEFAVDATIGSNGSISGSVSGLNTTITATRASDSGMTQQVAGFYQAGPANSSMTTYTIVGSSGQAFVLTVAPTSTDGGSGSVDAAGNISVTTAANTALAGTLSATTGTLAATLTSPTGARTDVMGGNQARPDVEKLLNLSTRNAVGGSAGVLIAGFVVNGNAPQPVLVRAVGPTLSAFGLTNALPAARLELFNGTIAVASNNAWDAASNSADVAATAARNGAFALLPRTRDAALLLRLEPGAYTAVVSGENNASGIALVEVYDVSQNAGALQKVVNIASRGLAGSGENTLTAGFVVSGSVPKRLLLRGVGPALGAFGVGGALVDPQLLVYRGSTVINSNDNWGDRADAAQIAASAASVGAFAFPAGSKDAALLINLMPGAYTVQVVGVGGTTGIALVEVYEVQ